MESPTLYLQLIPALAPRLTFVSPQTLIGHKRKDGSQYILGYIVEMTTSTLLLILSLHKGHQLSVQTSGVVLHSGTDLP